jgi:hypothetical protein
MVAQPGERLFETASGRRLSRDPTARCHGSASHGDCCAHMTGEISIEMLVCFTEHAVLHPPMERAEEKQAIRKWRSSGSPS